MKTTLIQWGLLSPEVVHSALHKTDNVLFNKFKGLVQDMRDSAYNEGLEADSKDVKDLEYFIINYPQAELVRESQAYTADLWGHSI